MVYQIARDRIAFPDPRLAEDDGLLAIGGDLSVERLLAAYRQGIYPWYTDEYPILWWSPDPRFVLFPEELKVSRSMEQQEGGKMGAGSTMKMRGLEAMPERVSASQRRSFSMSFR